MTLCLILYHYCFAIRKYILISARPINSPISGSILLDYFYTGYNLEFPISGILNKENITPRNFMEAAFVLARCFPISCSRGAAYTGLHRLAVAQAGCGGLLLWRLTVSFCFFSLFSPVVYHFLRFFLVRYVLYMLTDQFMPLYGHISPVSTQLFVFF